MKTRKFNIYNYNIMQKVEVLANEKLLQENKTIFGRDDVVINVSFQNINKYYMAEEIKKEFFDSLDKDIQKEIIKYCKEIYDKKNKITIENYKKIKKQTDFIFHDDKEYQQLCEVLENALYCQAETALGNFMNKKLSSKATRNIKYSIRNQEYMNISCD